MKTTTFQNVLNLAGSYAGRVPAKLPVSEQMLLQGYLAAEFRKLIGAQAWPELIPDFVNIQNVANNQFSKNEGQANEMGDILAVLDANPHQTDYWEALPYSEGDNVVYLDTPRTNVWVEYLLPYPGAVLADVSPAAMALAEFYAATLPQRFEDILAHRAAAYLLNADGQAAAADRQIQLANEALAREIQRLPPIPAWRGIRVDGGRHRRFGMPHLMIP